MDFWEFNPFSSNTVTTTDFQTYLLRQCENSNGNPGYPMFIFKIGRRLANLISSTSMKLQKQSALKIFYNSARILSVSLTEELLL